MDRLFWQLPGPSRFLDRVGRSLREGKNVFIVVPKHGPTRTRYAVAEVVTSREHHTWHPIDASEDGDDVTTPAELIARQCIPGGRPCTAKALSEHDHFSNMVVWVDGVHPSRWPKWRDFLEEYGQLCRARPEHERAVFCVSVPGTQKGELPAEDVVCSIHAWRGVVTRLDMTLFFSHLLAMRGVPPMHAKLWNAVGVELAGTDPELAVRLSEASLQSVLRPEPILEQLAHIRGWTPWGEARTPSWALGDEDVLDGKSVLHSARVHIEAGEKNEIERRIWRGQVGVLFPFIEEQRAELLPRLRRFLRVPYETPFGVITDDRDFELSHLLHQVRRGGADEPTKRLLERLTTIRHRLAHLESVPYEIIASPELARWFG